ncbi:MAG: hypothetical protein RLZZ342_395 [Candidatus Parcubacteria bacterium]|jgi:hypothetical protein
MHLSARLAQLKSILIPNSLSGLFLAPISLEGIALYPTDAVAELTRRAGNTDLRKQVEEYLQHDIPSYMQDTPVLCLARYIATPNFETLRFLALTEPFGLPAVVTEDPGDKFSAHNHLKRALCKLPITERLHQKHGRLHERFRPHTIIDFTKAEGKKLNEIETLWGEKLTAFHARAFAQMVKSPVIVANDTAWLDRNGRGNLLELYKRYLSLFVVHGILFEDYVLSDAQDAEFVKTIVRPAVEFVENKFGHKPLIAELVPQTFESSTFWISYPKRIRELASEQGLRNHL